MRSEILKLVADAGLERIAAPLLEASLPAIGFHVEVAQSACPAGVSKLGGRPWLPPDFDWPTFKERRLDFLLQIDLVQVRRCDPAGMLPATGTLSFFYDLDGQPWGYDPADLGAHRVVWSPESCGLVEHEVPHPELAWPECRLDLFPMTTFPRNETLDAQRLFEATALSDEEFYSYLDLVPDLEKSFRKPGTAGNHHLLGHAANVQGEMQLEAQLVTNGLYCGNSNGYDDPRRQLLEPGADQWLLLLQLDSDDSINVMWGDCGMVYVWIRREDLVNRRFDKTWLGLQCY
jgi:uncharacterized protein YwqG